MEERGKRVKQWLPTVFVVFLLLAGLITAVTVFGIGFFHIMGYTYTSFADVLLYFGCFVLIGLPLTALVQALIRMLCRLRLIRTVLGQCVLFGIVNVVALMLLLEVLDLVISGITVKEVTILFFALLFCVIQLVVQHWGKPGGEKEGDDAP